MSKMYHLVDSVHVPFVRFCSGLLFLSRGRRYEEPDHFYGPMEILSLPWVYVGRKSPVTRHSYSSTNFLLLGLMLADLAGSGTWERYWQLNGYVRACVCN